MGISVTIPSELLLDDYILLQLKEYTRDNWLWDTGGLSCAYANVPLLWTGSTSPANPGAQVRVYQSNDVHPDTLVVSGVLTDADGAFTFPLTLMRGVNKVIVEVDNESTTFYLTAYNWLVLTTAIAGELSEFKDEYDQVKRNNILQSSVSSLDIELPSLYKNFGYYTNIKKLPSQTVEEYNDFIVTMFEAYERGDMRESVKAPITAITGQSVFIRAWKEEDLIGLDPHFKLSVYDPPSFTVAYNGGIYDIDMVNYELQPGLTSVNPNSITYLYVNTTLDVNGYAEVLKTTVEMDPVDYRKDLGVVTSNSTCITYITGCNDFDNDAIYSSKNTYLGYIDVYVNGTVSTLEKAAIETIVRQVGAAYSRSFIYYDDGTIGRV